MAQQNYNNPYNNQQQQNQDQNNYGDKNQYMPKASEELYDQRKAHIYQLKGTFDKEKSILTLYIYDSMTHNEWEEKFYQKNFQNFNITDVAKQTVDAINTSMGGGAPMVSVQEYNEYAYVTVTGSQLPSFALPRKN
eukprot:147855_1